VLDLDRLDRDQITPVEPLDYLFARATAAHIDALYVAGRQIVAEGRPTGVDLGAIETALRAQYRERMPSRAAFLAQWPVISTAIADVYGCC
jgi:hypothetical protein